MLSPTKYLLVVAGPTAVGKTALAIQLAKHYKTVIISADSRQFYKQMDIGTAKPSKAELEEVTHYFIDNKEIEELVGAGHFFKEASALINELFLEHSLVVVVGGSGLYINALLNGVDEFEEVPAEIRNQLNEEFKLKGLGWLQSELKMADADYYDKVDLQNSQRMIRALEVYRYSGKPYSSFLNQAKKTSPFNSINVLINTDRQALYERINKRVDAMMDKGLLEEVKRLKPKQHLNALKTVGYKELFDYLDGHCSLETAVEKIKQHSRNYAKRQITWFKHQGNFEEFEPHDFEKICAYVDIILAHD